MIQIKTEDEVARMREAGLVVGRALEQMRAAVAPGVTTSDLDAIAEAEIRGSGAVPSFKGYVPHPQIPPFPGSICASVNDEIVHGIPGGRVLKEGDIVSLDCGAILDGWHGDAAVTVPVGEVAPELTELLRICENAMWHGFAAARLGGRVSDIGHAIETYVRGQGDYGIVEEYTGHGIGSEMHQAPNVPNYGRPGRGPKIQKGLVLAVEPMLNLGGRHTRTLEDDWTVVTADGSASAHFEHTFTVLEDGPWVLTSLDGGTAKLAALSEASAAP